MAAVGFVRSSRLGRVCSNLRIRCSKGLSDGWSCPDPVPPLLYRAAAPDVDGRELRE